MKSALPAEVLEARAAYIAVKRKYGYCGEAYCNQAAADGRTQCAKCLARKARGARRAYAAARKGDRSP